MTETTKESHYWKRFGDAYELIIRRLEKFIVLHPGIGELSKEITQGGGMRLVDVVDHLILPANEWAAQLKTAGFTEIDGIYSVIGSNLPSIAARQNPGSKMGLAIRVESIANFLMHHQLSREIEGSPFSPFRRCLLSTHDNIELWLIERRMRNIFEPAELPDTLISRCHTAMEVWKCRKRNGDDDDTAMEMNIQLARTQVQDVGAGLATSLFFQGERDYWQSRNRAASLQKMLLDKVGVGWANQDHHTYRSSRRHFPQLLQFFSMLGFEPRERFFAGVEAGWGAQVMEHPETGTVLFLDMDLGPDELDIDFFKNRLPEQEDLGTVGLWCGLHGESLLQAGLHHLAINSDFWQLRENLKKQGIRMMAPFSNLPYLKQAFTVGERWNINHQRLHALRITSRISVAEAVFFSDNGAIGSHVENIQRAEGYKGFSRQDVSSIIRDTDPRRH